MSTTLTKPRRKTRRKQRKVKVSRDSYYYVGRVCYHGRAANGRLKWKLPENKNCVELAKLGFSHQAIADATGLTLSQVQYRLSRVGVSVMSYRRGENDKAEVLIGRFSVSYEE